MSCSAAPRPGNMGRVRPDCQDRVRYIGGGMRSHGYPMKLTTTTTDAQGRSFSFTQETTELSKATLDPALFDVPAGYRQVNDYQGLMCQAAMNGSYGGEKLFFSSSNGRTNNNAGDDTSYNNSSNNNQDDETRRHRRGGRGALCVAPVTDTAKADIENEAWRDQLIGELQRVRVESVKLDSQNQFDLRAEAVERGCIFILYTDVLELREARPRPGLNPALNKYASEVHVKLDRTDEFEPYYDLDTKGTDKSMDAWRDSMLRNEAKDVAKELSKPPE